MASFSIFWFVKEQMWGFILHPERSSKSLFTVRLCNRAVGVGNFTYQLFPELSSVLCTLSAEAALNQKNICEAALAGFLPVAQRVAGDASHATCLAWALRCGRWRQLSTERLLSPPPPPWWMPPRVTPAENGKSVKREEKRRALIRRRWHHNLTSNLFFSLMFYIAENIFCCQASL